MNKGTMTHEGAAKPLESFVFARRPGENKTVTVFSSLSAALVTNGSTSFSTSLGNGPTLLQQTLQKVQLTPVISFQTLQALHPPTPFTRRPTPNRLPVRPQGCRCQAQQPSPGAQLQNGGSVPRAAQVAVGAQERHGGQAAA